jgi:hypothetical protein
MDTIDKSTFEDTNTMFEKPTTVDYHVSQWFNNTPEALLPVVNRFMGKQYDGL